MEDKKLLNNEELENISSGTVRPRGTCRLYCMNCDTYLKDDVPWEMAEQIKQLYETIHQCPNGNEPRIFIEAN